LGQFAFLDEGGDIVVGMETHAGRLDALADAGRYQLVMHAGRCNLGAGAWFLSVAMMKGSHAKRDR
jgi:hypothetical protein